MAEPTQFAFRSQKGVGLLDAAPVYQSPSGFSRPEGNIRCTAYSPDGRFFAWASPDQVSVVDPSIGHLVATLPAPNVYELGFSPLGTFLITWQRPGKDEEGNAIKNLRVWRTVESNATDSTRSVVGEFVQKSQTGWNLQYTSDEPFCARTVTNEVQFFRSGDLGTVWNKLRVEGVTDFAIAPGKDHSVAVFIPERKSQPAAVKLYIVPTFETPVSQKTFYKGDKVQLKWNKLGSSLIVLAQTDVDKSNRSYYGETNMYILSASGDFDSRVHLDKEGPIHDVTWSPSSKEFGVVYGYMPAKTTIFNTQAKAVHDFNLGPRNTILYSPHGRFVLVAGFGNLAGQVDIYDLEKDYEKVTTIEASNASVCEWSPDGKHFLTATTSPRLRVDNGVRIWHVGGGLMYNEEIDELYDITWRPQPPEKHTQEDPLHPVPTPHASALAYLGTVKTPSKSAGAYRPPGARGTSTPLHFKREDEGGAAFVRNTLSSTPSGGGVTNGFGGRPRRRDVPGAEPSENQSSLPPGAAPGGGVSLNVDNGDESLSKTALKNKKKREARKAKEAAETKDSELSGGDATGYPKMLEVRSPSQRRDGSRSRRDQSRPRRDQSKQRGEGSRSRNPRATSPSPANQSTKPPPRGPSNPNSTKPKSNAKPAKGNASAQPRANGPAINVAVNAPAIQETLATPITPSTPGSGSPHEKKVRALLKKLRAIDELKMRQANGESLELSQVSKIESEEKVRKELDDVGGPLG
ncbi:MAG: hypothetical protein M1831_005243 [Alyxoria varia]|nr:MAG: hypothetical protein M1831_005243 [Alyxoria varia]